MKELTICISDELYNNLLILEEITQNSEQIIIEGVQNAINRFTDNSGKLNPVKAIWERYPDELELQVMVTEATMNNKNVNVNEIIRNACIKQECYILCDQKIFTSKYVKIYLPDQKQIKSVPYEEISRI